MHPPQSLDYERLTHRALRQVIRMALETAVEGMPEGHRFYITFQTRAPGVKMPKELIAQYPDEMTVVLKQHYWELVPAPLEFKVTLSFNEKKTRLAIPYEAVTRFYDPLVSFGLHFPPDSIRPSVVSLSDPSSSEPDDPDGGADAAPQTEAQVLSLDAFRDRLS